MSSIPKGPGQARVHSTPAPQPQTTIPSAPPRPLRDAHLPHGSGDHISETRHPTPEQARAIDLLEYGTPGAGLVRLSQHQWAHVNRVVTALGALGIPTPRTAAEGERA